MSTRAVPLPGPDRRPVIAELVERALAAMAAEGVDQGVQERVVNRLMWGTPDGPAQAVDRG